MIHNKRDSRLVGREDALERLWDTLEVQSVLLSGPRRVGKSELLKEMVRAPRKGWTAIRIDLEGLTDLDGALVRIERDLEAAGLLTELAGTLQVKLKGPIEAETVEVGSDPWSTLERLLSAAIPKEGRLVVMLDEVPWWLDGLRTESDELARVALARLRYLRDKDPRLQMLLTGSIGLAGLARAIGASAELNDLFPMELGPLPRAHAETLFDVELTRRGKVAHGGAKTLAWKETGGSPYWLKLLAQRITGTTGVTEAHVTEQIEALLGPRLRNLFDDEGNAHLRKRHGGERGQRMRAVLSAAAAEDEIGLAALIMVAVANGERSRAAAEELVYILVDEYYLELDGERVRFLNPLLKRWWQRYGDLN